MEQLTAFKYVDKSGNQQTMYLTLEQIETVKQHRYIKYPDSSIIKIALK